jgi:hypothetical protein
MSGNLIDVGDFVPGKPQALALGLAFQHRAFQGHQLVADEIRHEVFEHAVFFG